MTAAMEQGWEREDDESLLNSCAEQIRALLTNNVGDLVIVVRTWAAETRSHSGLIFTSDASMPRGRDCIGRYVTALEEILRLHPQDGAIRDRLLWL